MHPSDDGVLCDERTPPPRTTRDCDPNANINTNNSTKSYHRLGTESLPWRKGGKFYVAPSGLAKRKILAVVMLLVAPPSPVLFKAKSTMDDATNKPSMRFHFHSKPRKNMIRSYERSYI